MSLKECNDTSLYCGVNERFICSICSDVIADALQGPCQHAFGGQCITTWVQTQQHPACPLCNCSLPPQSLKPALLMRQLVSELPMYCPNRFAGCDATMTQEAVQSHLKHSCSIMACAYGCGASFQRQMQDQHNMQCPHNPVRRQNLLKQIEDNAQSFHTKVVENLFHTLQEVRQPMDKAMRKAIGRMSVITEQLDSMPITRQDAELRERRREVLALMASLDQSILRATNATNELIASLSR